MKQMQKLKNEEGDSDDYLIELIGLKGDFPEEAMTAYGQVYDRFWDEMLTIAIKATKDEQKAMDLVSDTFNMVYSKAGTFKKEKIRNKENIHIAILYWMTRIMMNVFYDRQGRARRVSMAQCDNSFQASWPRPVGVTTVAVAPPLVPAAPVACYVDALRPIVPVATPGCGEGMRCHELLPLPPSRLPGVERSGAMQACTNS